MNKQKKHVNDRVIVYAVIWSLSYIGSLFALKTLDISQAAGIILSFVTILAFALFIYKYYRSIYFMDEVQIKIQMEAVVIGFSLGLLLMLALGLLELCIQLNKDDWSYRHLFPMFIAFYFIGLLISRNKYNFENEKHD
jgi:hypothetical protein